MLVILDAKQIDPRRNEKPADAVGVDQRSGAMGNGGLSSIPPAPVIPAVTRVPR
jgi:hypothetical protein